MRCDWSVHRVIVCCDWSVVAGLSDVDMTSLLTSLLPVRHRQQRQGRQSVHQHAARQVTSAGQSALGSASSASQSARSSGTAPHLTTQHAASSLGTLCLLCLLAFSVIVACSGLCSVAVHKKMCATTQKNVKKPHILDFQKL